MFNSVLDLNPSDEKSVVGDVVLTVTENLTTREPFLEGKGKDWTGGHSLFDEFFVSEDISMHDRIFLIQCVHSIDTLKIELN